MNESIISQWLKTKKNLGWSGQEGHLEPPWDPWVTSSSLGCSLPSLTSWVPIDLTGRCGFSKANMAQSDCWPFPAPWRHSWKSPVFFSPLLKSLSQSPRPGLIFRLSVGKARRAALHLLPPLPGPSAVRLNAQEILWGQLQGHNLGITKEENRGWRDSSAGRANGQPVFDPQNPI